MSTPAEQADTCAQCKKRGPGRSSPVFRKDLIRVQDAGGFVMPGQTNLKLTWMPSESASFICDDCIRSYKKELLNRLYLAISLAAICLSFSLWCPQGQSEFRALAVMGFIGFGIWSVARLRLDKGNSRRKGENTAGSLCRVSELTLLRLTWQAYSIAGFERGLNTPQSIVRTVPGRAASRAVAIL
jgi:hypothetical protein